MKTIALIIAAAAAFIAGGCAPADVDGPTLADNVEHTFLALDQNRDEFISRAEAAAAPLLARRFDAADADNDGVLNRYEFNSPGWRPFLNEPD